MSFAGQVITQIIADQFEIHPDQVTPKSSFYDDLDVDSLGIIELVMRLEDAFGIEITDAEMKKIKTVEDAIDLVSRKVTPSTP